jgi:MutS domain V
VVFVHTTPRVNPIHEYARRLEARRSALARLDRIHIAVGNWRLSLFVAAALLAWLSFVRAALSPWWLALPAIFFFVLFVIHERVLQTRRRLDRAATFYEKGIARLENRWAGTGEKGECYIDESHPYARDLDLFGHGSLFELMCTARTRAGEDTLARWLRLPASAVEARARQSAVAELTSRLDLREELALLGDDVRSGLEPDALATWGAAPPVVFPGWTRIVAMPLAFFTVLALIQWLVLGFTSVWFQVMLLLEAAFWLRLRIPTMQVVSAVERPGRDLALLSQVLARLEREPFASPRLVSLRAELDTAGSPPSRQIARLGRLVDLLDAQRNQLFAPIAFLLLWSTQLAIAIENWRRISGPAVGRWLAAVGEFEALCALAGYGYEHPADPFPELAEQGICFEGEGLGHPLLPAELCVRNDVRLGGELRVLLISGSNMSGKSTLLRTVGTNAVLAFAGAPVRAARLRLSPLSVGASIRIVDSLQAGSSRFYAEITRLRQLVDMAKGPFPLLFLLDELLHGTNSHDRRIGAEAVVRGLVDRGAMGLCTTHDLALAEIVETLGPRAANVHFQDHIEDGKIVFDYVMRPGIVRKSNALELMRSVGLEV